MVEPMCLKIGDPSRVDLPEIESFRQGVKADEELDEFTVLRLAAVAKHLDSARPAFMAVWTHFSEETTIARLCSDDG